MGSMVTQLLAPSVLTPLAVVTLTLISYAAKAAGDHFRQTAHASRVGMIADAASRVAGDIAARLAASPPSADMLGAVKAAAIAEGVSYLQASLPDTVKKVGVSPDVLHSMISGELGKLSAAH